PATPSWSRSARHRCCRAFTRLRGPAMRSLWSNRDADTMAERYAADGIARDLALRVYTSRLLGGDPNLVLHGGGNTSVKTEATDLVGEPAEVLCVKGSGW